MQITDANFQQRVLKSERPVLVDFWASWCPPCKMMQPMVDRLHDELAPQADILSLNIDQNPQTAAEYEISAVPTFVSFIDGKEVERKTGALTENQLRKMVPEVSGFGFQVSESSHSDTPVIVTGLPRSGTSMMMKMLEAGGVPVLCDQHRAADGDNPNGYYEFEPVKRTQQDPSWLQQAAGKAVKMVYSLLYDLPAERQYKVIFMRRELSEILASQSQMLDNMGITSDVDDTRMAQLFENEIVKFRRWIETSEQIDCVEVPYNDIASGSRIPLEQINSHLGNHLNLAAMSAVVDPTLYRNRAA